MSMDLRVFDEKIDEIARKIKSLFNQLKSVVKTNEALRSENSDLKAQVRTTKNESAETTKKLKKIQKALSIEA